MRLQPRAYQTEAIDAAVGAWLAGVQRPALVLATGLGKTVCFAVIASRMARGGRRPVVFVHRDELVRQTVAKLREVDPGLVVGVVQGKRTEIGGDVVVASIQTISRQSRLDRIPRNQFSVLICDECHHSASPSWRRTLEWFGAFDKASGAVALGVTATMHRSDRLGLGEVWQDVVFVRDIRFGIQNGYLSPVTAKTVTIEGLNTDEMKTRHGDLADGDLGRAMARAEAGPMIAAAYVEHAAGPDGLPRRGILFAPTVETATSFARDFRAAGVPTELVVGTTPVEDRQAVYDRVRRGETQVIASCGVLTEGFDLPCVEVAVMARPTKSRGLYVQCVGRILRPSVETGKESALILDVVGSVSHGLSTIVDLGLDRLADDEVIELDELDEDGLPMIVPRILPDIPDEIGFQDVNPFDGMTFMGPPPKVVKERPRKNFHWALTRKGIPFLPPFGTEGELIFIWGNGPWTVGRKQRRQKAERASEHDTFAEAVSAAQNMHPASTGWRPSRLTGSATESQLRMLNMFKVEYDPVRIDKQEASDIIGFLLASVDLDPKS